MFSNPSITRFRFRQTAVPTSQVAGDVWEEINASGLLIHTWEWAQTRWQSLYPSELESFIYNMGTNNWGDFRPLPFNGQSSVLIVDWELATSCAIAQSSTNRKLINLVTSQHVSTQTSTVLSSINTQIYTLPNTPYRQRFTIGVVVNATQAVHWGVVLTNVGSPNNTTHSSILRIKSIRS